jgi:hypothetical protein
MLQILVLKNDGLDSLELTRWMKRKALNEAEGSE